MGKVKNIIIFALLVLIVGAVAFLHFKLDIFGLKDDSLKIDRTALIIEETKKISEFTSAHFYEEIVVKKERVDKGTLMNTRNEVVIIARGNVRAGFNLSRLEQGSFKIHGDTMDVNLPTPEIFEIIVNPSNYDVFVEDGKWSHDEITAVVMEAKDKIQADAIKNGILDLASKSAVANLRELFKSFGFKVVNISVASKNN